MYVASVPIYEIIKIAELVPPELTLHDSNESLIPQPDVYIERELPRDPGKVKTTLK